MPGIYKGTQAQEAYIGTTKLAGVYSGTTKLWPLKNYASYVGVYTATAATGTPYSIYGASHAGVTGGVSVTSPSNAIDWNATIDNYGALAGIVNNVFEAVPKNTIAGAAGTGTKTMVQAFNGQSRNSYACGLKSFVTTAQGDNVNEFFIRIAADGTIIWSSLPNVTVTNPAAGFYSITVAGLQVFWAAVTINPPSNSTTFNGYTAHTLYGQEGPTTNVMTFNSSGTLNNAGFCFSGFVS
jgi:hypothetical protein